MDVTINFANPLAGIDQWVHGSNLHGWGGPAVPDRTLYTVQKFDPSRNAFTYDVNQRFGNTRASATTLRSPFRVTINVAVDIARSLPDQMLDWWLRPGRAGMPGTRVAASDLVRRLSTTVPDPFAELLQQADSLLLTAAQTAELRTVDAGYRAHVDSTWQALGAYLADLPDHYDASGASRRVDDTTDELWEYSRTMVQSQLTRVLSPSQTAMLGGWAGQLYRARDRVHIRLTPSGR